MSVLVALRLHILSGPSPAIIVDVRLAEQIPSVLRAAESGILGPAKLSVQAVASDDILARVIARATRGATLHFALREGIF